MEIHCNFQEQFKSQYKEEFSNCFSKQKFLYIYISVRTAQELSLNSSSKTVLEKVLKENGPFMVQELSRTLLRTYLAQFLNYHH